MLKDNEKLGKKEYIALKEYEFGDKLRESYFKNSWVATSILLPMCFGLIGLSFTEWAIKLSWVELLPLAVASFSLLIFWAWYVSRYAHYLKIIFERLQMLEKTLGMYLHRGIEEKRTKGLRRLKALNRLTMGMLALTWALRLYSASIG